MAESADGDDEDDYMDEGMRVVDSDALTRINQVIQEHTSDIEMAQSAPGILNSIFNKLKYKETFAIHFSKFSKQKINNFVSSWFFK